MEGEPQAEKKSVYIETTIVSYLTARPSRDLFVAAWQKITGDWWRTANDRFAIYASLAVLDEAAQGDPEAAKRRLECLAQVPLLGITDEVTALSEALIVGGAVPPGAVDDAIHIAAAAVAGVDYLLTWNFRHIDNAETKPLIRAICAARGHRCPEICTPQELMGIVGNVG